MTVYIDNMRARFGRMRMSHMVADTEAELIAMADTIGVARKWHQKPGTADSHFDICDSKCARALAAGAVLIDLRTLSAMVFQRRVTGSLGNPDDAVAWVRNRRGKS